MNIKTTSRAMTILVTLALLFSLFSTSAGAAPNAAPSSDVTFTILHTNDFHGQLEASSSTPTSASNPGSARIAAVVNAIRAAKGAANVLLVDAGDQMQGSLLSNLGDGTPTGKGMPTIGIYNAMGYDVATFGNHEFDFGQENLVARTTQADFPYVTANIVQNDTGNCATATWVTPAFADAPYKIAEVGSPVSVKVAFIGVTTTETPTITVATATAGLCFKDPADSIIHYYDAMKADGADVIVVLSHLGFGDGGYGYGIPVYGDQTLAAKLNSAGKPVNLIIGGHSHTNLMPGATGTLVGSTTIAQAYYNGRNVGKAEITVSTTGSVSVNWKTIAWKIPPTTTPPSTTPFGWKEYSTSTAFTDFLGDVPDSAIATLINEYKAYPPYVALVSTPVGYSSVNLPRSGGTVDNMMGTFIDDAIYNYLNSDLDGNGQPITTNDVDIFFNNAGGIRTDWCWNGTAWVSTNCAAGNHEPALLNYGHMFTILPFGNATIVGKMTGAKILEVLHYGPNVTNGVIQPAGLKYKYFKYTDSNPGPQPYAWGAFEITVLNKATGQYEPLDLNKTYRVGTNEFLAPAGGDGYSGFKYMTDITYWGDMLNAVNAYVGTNYGTADTAYAGPTGNGNLDGRITRDTSIVPLTILHHNDSHGNLAKTTSGTSTYAGYTQLATLITQERKHNPDRTLLLSSGDNIQGDAMSYYFKTAPTGFTSNGTPIADPALHFQPLIKVFNSMGYDAMTLGNHEFNFGSDVFKSILSQATFPILQANVTEDPANPYGLAAVNVQPSVEKHLGDIDVAILGIGNHRIPNYELPSNIPGLTFSNPIAKTQELATLLRPTNDVVIALTHIGFTENPSSVEVDANVDTNLVANVTGLDALVGGHSHTNPASGFGAYKYLPSIVVDKDGKPVIVGQAYRYNNTLGELSIGLRPLGGGKYEVVSQTGRYLSVVASGTSATAEDPAVKAIVDPYVALLNTYNNTAIGSTTVPIDTTNAYIGETNAANLQAEASIYELNQHGITPDFHLSGAMTQSNPKVLFSGATAGSPASVKVSDMFTLMPYENSLVVLSMNGPQLKTVLERAYRNYYYYKYVTGYGGYSYYTTCMLDTNAIGKILYKDTAPALPNGNNVVALVISGKPVDFTDASTYYKVSTVNYLAAGSCNFNDGGVSLWPLNQILNDTQYYVRDAVIDYITAMGTVSPKVEGRLAFGDTTAPLITINAPMAMDYLHPDYLTLDFTATDNVAVKTITARLDSATVTNGQVIDLYNLTLGKHTLIVTATDFYENATTQSVDFSVIATVQSLRASVNRQYDAGLIKKADVRDSLLKQLDTAQMYLNQGNIKAAKNSLNAFISLVKAQSGKAITKDAAQLLIADAAYVIDHPK